MPLSAELLAIQHTAPQRADMLKMLRAKLHRIRVTGANLAYHGSITLDPEICERVGMIPLEFVEIWNTCSGARLETYILYGERGSRCCILNGAAARTCQCGDPVIIAASEYVNYGDAHCLNPRVLTFDDANAIESALQYETYTDERGARSMRVNAMAELPAADAMSHRY
jgi:aspartate 1-decarboxylase